MVGELEKDAEKDIAEDAATATFKLTWKHKSAICGAAMTLCGPFIRAHEGDVMRSYQDIGHHWASCEGADDAIPNHTYTQAECDKIDQRALQAKIDGVYALIKVPVTPTLLAAHVSFAYNIGLGAYSRSKTLKLTNSGYATDGCAAMLDYYRAGGYDCKVRANNCYGVWTRRQDEKALCLKGVK